MEPAGRLLASEMPPLMGTILWNKPAAWGAVSSARALMAPADCPISVTLAALPPNLAMLRWMKVSACTLSSSA